MIKWSPKEEWDAAQEGGRGNNNPPEGVIMIGNEDLTLPPDHVIIAP
jgi:hypothetical protein